MTAEAEQAGGPLSDLLRARMEELGLTFRALAERCVDPEPEGEGERGRPLWSRSTLALLAQGKPIKVPTFTKIRALAAGLELDSDVVREAAGKQFLQVDTLWTGDRTARAFVRNFEGLSHEDQDKVWALIEEHRRVRDE